MDALRPTTDPQTNSQSSAVILIVHCHWPMLQCSIAVMILSRSAQPMPYGDSYEEPLRLLPWQVRSGAVSSSVQELLFADMRRSLQGLASSRSRQAQELVGLS